MRYLRFSLLAVMAMMATLLQAQKSVMRADSVTTPAGKVVSLPVILENTGDVTGVQFDIDVPYELKTDEEGNFVIEPSRLRIPGHTVLCRLKDRHWHDYLVEGVTRKSLEYYRYRVMVYSETKDLVIDDRGTLLTLQFAPDLSHKDKDVLPIYIQNVVLSSPDKQEVPATSGVGAVIIEEIPRPDLIPADITFTPSTLEPGGKISVSWVVKNIGQAPTESGWTEQVSLVSIDGTVRKLITTAYYDNTLSAGGAVSRTLADDVVMPELLGIDGVARVEVQVVPTDKTGEHPSLRDNNTQFAADNINIGKRLTLELSKTRFTEGGSQRFSCKLNRSGRWTNIRTFSITCSDTRLEAPATVTIPMNQSGTLFYLTVNDNDVVDADSVVTITIVGDNYEPATAKIVIEDNEYPQLGVTSSKSTLTEGEEFVLTITTPRVSAQPIEVKINSEDNKRFSFPSTAVIPAGQSQVEVTVKTKDDEVPNLVQSNKFTVSAKNLSANEVIVILEDNDMPVLNLTLTPDRVSEAAGPTAIAAVLTRTGKTNNKVTIKISDDSNGGLYYSSKTLVMDKGVETIFFNLGPVDNIEQEGDRTYTLRAGIWVSSCSCAAQGEAAGSVSAQIQVLDNDGPALNVASEASTVKEGGETTLTVSRNTTNDLGKALTVKLSSNADDELDYQKSVTIPAGETSTLVNVKSKKNDVTGDSRTVIFTVQADGFASGTCFLLVTDQTLPDARISSLTASATEQTIDTEITFDITVVNEGVAVLPAGTVVKMYMDGTIYQTANTDRDLQAGESIVLKRKGILPQKVGDHVFHAVVNENQTVNELVYTNNTSENLTITATSPFSITVKTDKTRYRQGDKVEITGQVKGQNSADVDIDVYMINNGTREVKKAHTDINGNFSMTWELYILQSGHFAVGACFVDDPTKEEMASFDVYGLNRTDKGYITCDVTVGYAHSGIIGLQNGGSLALTGVKAEILESPAGINAEFSVPENIAGGETVDLSYVLHPEQPTEGNKWEELKVRVTSIEGASLDITLHCYARTAKGNLVVESHNLVTTMNKDNGRDYSFIVTNNGKGNSGKISLSLPDWITPLTGTTMPGLNQNDTVTVVLRLMPTSDMQLNVPVTGSLGINCENGNGTFMNFTITPVSDLTGTLTVDVCDEYTYYTDEKPHVSGAQVVLRNPVTGAFVAEGLTGEDGIFSITLPEGYYQVNVTADNHDSYRNNVLVDPGSTKLTVVNLSYQAISVSWDVEETEVEDEYSIVTTVKYETNVPVPVVETIVPDMVDIDQLGVGESLIFYAILTNKGLINAENTCFTFPEEAGGCKWEAMVQNTGLLIAPQQSITIPVKVTRMATGLDGRMREEKVDADGCVTRTETVYEWKCSNIGKMYEYSRDVPYRVCKGDVLETILEVTGGGLRDPNGGGPGSLYGYASNNNKVSSDNSCSPCLENIGNWFLDVVDCGMGIVGVFGGTPGTIISAVWGIGRSLYCTASNWPSKKDTTDERWKKVKELSLCGLGFVNTVVGIFPPAAGYSAAVGCILMGVDWYRGCGAPDPPKKKKLRAMYEGEAPDSVLLDEPSWLTEYREKTQPAKKFFQAEKAFIDEIFGDSVWTENTTTEELTVFTAALIAAIDNDSLDAESLMSYKPANITIDQFNALVDRFINTLTLQETDNALDFDALKEYSEAMEEANNEANSLGYDDIGDLYKTEIEKLEKTYNESKGSVCATISLQIEQTMTMTRQAFRGTLTITNGNTTTPMRDIKLKLNVTNKQTGMVATSKEFEMHTESLKILDGDLDMESGWYLGADSTGTATILFIPSKYAAPEEPVDYAFGGTLSYIDPYNGFEVTRDLYPVTLTVKPSPELDLTYFMQRDLYGDDPLTEAVEPVVAGEFALIINNKGNGDATNVRMVTKQPKIIENEKGLFINFEFVSSQLNGQEKAMAMGESIPTEFGNIPAHTQAYAQWWLESTLLGHFVDYDIKATHVSSYGNENLSLLDEVTIHELIHGFTPVSASDGSSQSEASQVPSAAVGRAFLVNDISDADDLPDQVYFTDGTQEDVAIATKAVVTKQSDTEYTLTVIPQTEGWNYSSLLDPTVGRRNLLSVVRLSDNVELPVDNVWQTDRTIVDGKDWRYENRLHFVFEMDSVTLEGEAYKLVFEERAEVELQVESITGMELTDGQPVRTVNVDEVAVTFNKAIKPETFTSDDVRLAVQGVQQDLSQMTITADADSTNFKLNLAALNENLGNGYYVMTVQTADITDYEGFTGRVGKKADWVLFRGGLVRLVTEAWPEQGGTITREPLTPNGARRFEAEGDVSSMQYGDSIRLTAIPAEGYEFVNWTIGGAEVSRSAVYVAKATADTYLVANFKKRQYRVEMSTDGYGTLDGTGLYDHGTELAIVARPLDGYALAEWVVDGETVAGMLTDTLRVTVTRSMTVKALFTRAIFAQTLTMMRGWNWVSSYLSEPQLMGDVMKYADRVVGQSGVLVNDSSSLTTFEPGQSYKVRATTIFSHTMRGRVFDQTTSVLDVKKDWNWIAYPGTENRLLAEVLANAEEGDFLLSQEGFSGFEDNSWEGQVTTLTPGKGYLYKSVSDKQLAFRFHEVAGSRFAVDAPSSSAYVDVRRYPSTMNIIARLHRDREEVSGENFTVYAMAGEELRGIGQLVGGNFYLTVYGDEPADIMFIVESAETAETFEAVEKLQFASDVVGSRKQPFVLNISTDGIDQVLAGTGRMTVYTVEGILVARDATIKTLHRLPKGIYIVNGRKTVVK